GRHRHQRANPRGDPATGADHDRLHRAGRHRRRAPRHGGIQHDLRGGAGVVPDDLCAEHHRQPHSQALPRGVRMNRVRPNPARQARKRLIDLGFRALCASATVLGMLALVLLLWDVASVGLKHLSIDFIREFPDQMDATRSGIWPALMGTLWLMGLTALLAIPLGVGAAIYLEEYARKSRFNTILEINISNLSG